MVVVVFDVTWVLAACSQGVVVFTTSVVVVVSVDDLQPEPLG